MLHEANIEKHYSEPKVAYMYHVMFTLDISLLAVAKP